MNKTPTQKGREEFLDKIRNHLESMKTALNRESAADVQAAQSVGGNGSTDDADLAWEEGEQRMKIILSTRERERIVEIDYALRRMDEGDYGVCEACGFEITETRLQTMPFTRHCRDCQQDREREAKGWRRDKPIDQERSQEFSSDPAEG
jgi:DnaK suppressor protein